jgi:hypothetical protein
MFAEIRAIARAELSLQVLLIEECILIRRKTRR